MVIAEIELEKETRTSLHKQAIDALRAMEKRSGVIYEEDVVDAARDPDSPIHSCFEWDDSVCGEEYRLIQARDLIRRVKLEVVIEDVTIRAPRYISITQHGGVQSYSSRLRMSAGVHTEMLLDEVRRILGNVVRTSTIVATRPGPNAKMVADALRPIRNRLEMLIEAMAD